MILCDSENCIYNDCNLGCAKVDVVIEDGVCVDFDTVEIYLTKNNITVA